MSNAIKPMFVLALLALFGYLLTFGGCAPHNDWAKQPGAGNPEIQAILREVSCRHKIVGLGAGIVRSAGDPDLAVVGWSKAGSETPVGLNDLWHIGSCTKAMTATLAAKLVEEGKLHWHITLAEVFPELAEKLDPAKRRITLEELLSHRSGLRRDPSRLVYLSNLGRSPAGQRLAVLRHVPESKLMGSPGDRYSYSNFGYILAGAMIEQITNQQFEDVIRTRLFAPLDMLSPEYEGTHTYGDGGVIWSHSPSGRPVSRLKASFGDPPSLRPAGCVRCSLGDWARFIRHHLMGEMGDSEYLQAETYRELHRSRGDNYALGWALLQSDWGDGTVLWHNGSNGWNYSLVRIAPKKGFAVFVCANRGKCRGALDEVADRLIDLQNRDTGIIPD
jgi:CubicO group peptidase (beta-lactamase class C family)